MGCGLEGDIDVRNLNIGIIDTNVSGGVDVDSLEIDFSGDAYGGTMTEAALESQIVIDALEIQLVQAVDFQPTVLPSIRTTLLTITQAIPTGQDFYTNSGGTYYVKERDDGDLRDTSTKFLEDESVQFYLNGSNLVKGEHVIWTSQWSFVFGFAVDVGDFLKILT